MSKKNKRPVTLPYVLFFFLTVFSSYAATPGILVPVNHLPLIPRLESTDPLFQQYCQDVEQSYILLARNESLIPQQFYRYIAGPKDTLFTVAARLSIPYETLATLNNIDTTKEFLSGRMLILPVVPGLFIAKTPVSSYELLLQKRFGKKISENPELYQWFTIESRTLCFLQNERFSSTERAFFLDASMVMPLAKSVMTSSYGYRVSPISGTWKFHPGIDLAAPIGSTVYACKGGQVSTVDYNSTYGNFIILCHDGGMTSVYAHLSKVLVKKGDTVSAGSVIGLVGTTGASTGPHLHFEVRVNGSPTDPGPMIGVKE
jgi:murein DD-endopeptidase MepM/ murein hydrolase activator NlpD